MRQQTVTQDCPDRHCMTRNAEMTRHPGATTGLRCKECGRLWGAPMLEVAQNVTDDDEYTN